MLNISHRSSLSSSFSLSKAASSMSFSRVMDLPCFPAFFIMLVCLIALFQIHRSFVTEPGPSESEPPLDLPADVSACRKAETKEDGVVITTVITEEKRLSAAIAAIDHDCAIVPHGAYIKTADGTVVQKRNFEGLSTADSATLDNYLHFRVPIVKRTALERSQQDKSVDFLDLVSGDVPKGCWSLQYERGGQVAVLKNLLWPGFTFFHCPGTKDHGYVYNGTAQKNADLAFMLP